MTDGQMGVNNCNYIAVYSKKKKSVYKIIL